MWITRGVPPYACIRLVSISSLVVLTSDRNGHVSNSTIFSLPPSQLPYVLVSFSFLYVYFPPVLLHVYFITTLLSYL